MTNREHRSQDRRTQFRLTGLVALFARKMPVKPSRIHAGGSAGRNRLSVPETRLETVYEAEIAGGKL